MTSLITTDRDGRGLLSHLNRVGRPGRQTDTVLLDEGDFNSD